MSNPVASYFEQASAERHRRNVFGGPEALNGWCWYPSATFLAIPVNTISKSASVFCESQTLFSAELLRRRFPAAQIESVALCTHDDEVLRPLLEAHAGCRVVVAPPASFEQDSQTPRD